MDPSGSLMIRELSVLFSIGAVATMLQPSTSFIWDNFRTGKQILEFIGELPEWANYESNLKDNLDSIKGKKRELRCMEEDLEDEVNNIEFQTNGKRKREVSNWLRNVKAKLDNVDNNEEEEILQRRKFISRFIFRAWVGKCLKMEEEELDNLIKRKEAFGSGLKLVLDASNGTIQYQLVTSSLIGKASSGKRLEIWTMLLKPKIRILGIVGEEGMGKTTMMENIYNLEIAYDGLFKRAFYVNVREDFDHYQLQAAIGEAMDLRDLVNINNARRRAARIHDALIKCGEFLLILDGLSECFQFRLTEVGIPFKENGGKLVVVSRSENVCKMVCDYFVRLENLPEADSEELFWKTRRSSAELSPEIVDVAKEIIRKCGGVPIKIVNTAESLSGVDDICEWRVKLSEL